ncbi:MAG: hypothetical protein PPP58_06590 [Natronomonas sp.]
MTENDRSTQRRRQFVQALGASAVVATAGCLGSDDDSSTGDWRTATLEDTTTGEQFSIAEFERPTLLHTFASNCLTCASQQAEFVTLWERRDDIEIVELTVDPNDTPEDIAAHAEEAGLAWHVGVAPEPVVGALTEEFGQEVQVSAQSPIIVVCPGGTTNTISKVADPAALEAAIDETC